MTAYNAARPCNGASWYNGDFAARHIFGGEAGRATTARRSVPPHPHIYRRSDVKDVPVEITNLVTRNQDSTLDIIEAVRQKGTSVRDLALILLLCDV